MSGWWNERVKAMGRRSEVDAIESYKEPIYDPMGDVATHRAIRAMKRRTFWTTFQACCWAIVWMKGIDVAARFAMIYLGWMP